MNIEKMQQQGREALSKSTPMTTALAFALCAGAFWVGNQTSMFQMFMAQTAGELEDADDERKDMRDLLKQVSEVSMDNKRRIDSWEDRQ